MNASTFPIPPESKHTDPACPYEANDHRSLGSAQLALRAKPEHVRELFAKQRRAFLHLLLDLRRLAFPEMDVFPKDSYDSRQLDKAFELHALATAIAELVLDRVVEE